MKNNIIIKIQNILPYADESLLNFIYEILRKSVPESISSSLTSDQQVA